MAVLAWLVAPVLADWFAGDGIVPMAKALFVSLSVGLVWQFVLVAILVGREQGTSPLVDDPRGALASLSEEPAQRPRGRAGLARRHSADRRLRGVQRADPGRRAPENREFATLVESDAGKAFLDGAWGWYGLVLVMFVFTTALGEELLFRGYLLPRMNGAFGRGDWVANGLLFTGYHLHVPWAMAGDAVRHVHLAYPTKRYRSAWIGIAVHSAQSVVFALLILTL